MTKHIRLIFSIAIVCLSAVLFAGNLNYDNPELVINTATLNRASTNWGSQDIELSVSFSNDSNEETDEVRITSLPELIIKDNSGAVIASNLVTYTVSGDSLPITLTGGQSNTCIYHLDITPFPSTIGTKYNLNLTPSIDHDIYENSLLIESATAQTANDVDLMVYPFTDTRGESPQTPPQIPLPEANVLTGTYDEPFHLLSGQTYCVPSNVIFRNKLYVHGGTIVKLGNMESVSDCSSGKIILSGAEAQVISVTGPNNYALFTSVHDNRSGESISTITPEVDFDSIEDTFHADFNYHYYAALYFESSVNQPSNIEYCKFGYGKYGIYTSYSDQNLTVKNSIFKGIYEYSVYSYNNQGSSIYSLIFENNLFEMPHRSHWGKSALLFRRFDTGAALKITNNTFRAPGRAQIFFGDVNNWNAQRSITDNIFYDKDGIASGNGVGVMFYDCVPTDPEIQGSFHHNAFFETQYKIYCDYSTMSGHYVTPSADDFILSSSPFAAAQATGSYYLNQSSALIDGGSRSSAEAGVNTKTTQAPANAIDTTILVTKQINSDTDIVDIGYHYPRIDYLLTSIPSANTFTIAGGVTIALDIENPSYSDINMGANYILSMGTFYEPVTFTTVRATQDRLVNGIAHSQATNHHRLGIYPHESEITGLSCEYLPGTISISIGTEPDVSPTEITVKDCFFGYSDLYFGTEEHARKIIAINNIFYKSSIMGEPSICDVSGCTFSNFDPLSNLTGSSFCAYSALHALSGGAIEGNIIYYSEKLPSGGEADPNTNLKNYNNEVNLNAISFSDTALTVCEKGVKYGFYLKQDDPNLLWQNKTDFNPLCIGTTNLENQTEIDCTIESGIAKMDYGFHYPFSPTISLSLNNGELYTDRTYADLFATTNISDEVLPYIPFKLGIYGEGFSALTENDEENPKWIDYREKTENLFLAVNDLDQKDCVISGVLGIATEQETVSLNDYVSDSIRYIRPAKDMDYKEEKEQYFSDLLKKYRGTLANGMPLFEFNNIGDAIGDYPIDIFFYDQGDESYALICCYQSIYKWDYENRPQCVYSVKESVDLQFFSSAFLRGWNDDYTNGIPGDLNGLPGSRLYNNSGGFTMVKNGTLFATMWTQHGSEFRGSIVKIYFDETLSTPKYVRKYIVGSTTPDAFTLADANSNFGDKYCLSDYMLQEDSNVLISDSYIQNRYPYTASGYPENPDAIFYDHTRFLPYFPIQPVGLTSDENGNLYFYHTSSWNISENYRLHRFTSSSGSTPGMLEKLYENPPQGDAFSNCISDILFKVSKQSDGSYIVNRIAGGDYSSEGKEEISFQVLEEHQSAPESHLNQMRELDPLCVNLENKLNMIHGSLEYHDNKIYLLERWYLYEEFVYRVPNNTAIYYDIALDQFDYYICGEIPTVNVTLESPWSHRINGAPLLGSFDYGNEINDSYTPSLQSIAFDNNGLMHLAATRENVWINDSTPALTEIFKVRGSNAGSKYNYFAGGLQYGTLPVLPDNCYLGHSRKIKFDQNNKMYIPAGHNGHNINDTVYVLKSIPVEKPVNGDSDIERKRDFWTNIIPGNYTLPGNFKTYDGILRNQHTSAINTISWQSPNTINGQDDSRAFKLTPGQLYHAKVKYRFNSLQQDLNAISLEALTNQGQTADIEMTGSSITTHLAEDGKNRLFDLYFEPSITCGAVTNNIEDNLFYVFKTNGDDTETIDMLDIQITEFNASEYDSEVMTYSLSFSSPTANSQARISNSSLSPISDSYDDEGLKLIVNGQDPIEYACFPQGGLALEADKLYCAKCKLLPDFQYESVHISMEVKNADNSLKFTTSLNHTENTIFEEKRWADLKLWFKTPVDMNTDSLFTFKLHAEVECGGSMVEQVLHLGKFSVFEYQDTMKLPDNYNKLVYYVDGISGSDSGFGTKYSPWKTINGALSQIYPSIEKRCRINVAGNQTYMENVDIEDSKRNYVEICGGYDRDTWFRDTEGFRTYILSAVMSSNSSIDGLIIHDDAMVLGVGNVVISNCIFNNMINDYTKNNAIRLSNAKNVTIANNIFSNYHNGSDGQAILLGTSVRARILNNLFYHLDKGMTLIMDDSVDIEISNNIFEDVPCPMYGNISYNTTSPIPVLKGKYRIYCNKIISNTTGPLIQIYQSFMMGPFGTKWFETSFANPAQPWIWSSSAPQNGNEEADFNKDDATAILGSQQRDNVFDLILGSGTALQYMTSAGKTKLENNRTAAQEVNNPVANPPVNNFNGIDEDDNPATTDGLNLFMETSYHWFLPSLTEAQYSSIADCGITLNDLPAECQNIPYYKMWYQDRSENLSTFGSITNTEVNDLGFTGGPFANFQTPFLNDGISNKEGAFHIPRPHNVQYTKSDGDTQTAGDQRTITFSNPLNLSNYGYWQENIKGFMIIRGRADDPEKKEYLLDYESHGSLEKGKQYFVGDDWGDGKIIHFVDYDSEPVSPYSFIDTVPESGKYYSYQVIAVYQPYEPGSLVEYGQSTDFIYSFWNTKKQILLENHVVYPGGELKMIDPSRTFDFNELDEGLTLNGNILEIIGQRDSVENGETNDVYHAIKFDYPKQATVERVIDGQATNIDISPIHIFNEPFKCSLILGEYVPDLYELIQNNPRFLLPFYKIGIDNQGYYLGTIKETLSNISTDKTQDIFVQNPDIGFYMCQNGKEPYEMYPIPMNLSPEKMASNMGVLQQNQWKCKCSIKLPDKIQKSNYPKTIAIQIISLDENDNNINLPSDYDNIESLDLTLHLQEENLESGVLIYQTSGTEQFFFINDVSCHLDPTQTTIKQLYLDSSITIKLEDMTW